jgi:2-C-methyl-D-erythritol 4-phosphate cytidylyltransferase
MPEKASAIIVAGGRGRRLGGPTPKGFVALGGTPLFAHALRQFDSHGSIVEVILVVPPGAKDRAGELLDDVILEKGVTVVEGGEHRWQSVKNGLAACRSPSPWVVVHDAARPFVTHAVIDALLEKAGPYECAVTATPEVDTVRRVRGDRSVETVDRSTLVRVGTPQLFGKEKLAAAFDKAVGMNPPPTDEAVLMEMMGIPVGIAQGDPMNFKITTKTDLRIAEALLSSGA